MSPWRTSWYKTPLPLGDAAGVKAAFPQAASRSAPSKSRPTEDISSRNGASAERCREHAPFEGDHLLTAQVNSPESRSSDGHARAELPRRLREQVEALPGVTAAAVTNRLPVGVPTPRLLFTIDARQGPDDDQRLHTTVLSVSPGYLPTMGVPLIQGRAFTTRVSSSVMVLTVPSTPSCCPYAAMAPENTVAGVRPRRR